MQHDLDALYHGTTHLWPGPEAALENGGGAWQDERYTRAPPSQGASQKKLSDLITSSPFWSCRLVYLISHEYEMVRFNYPAFVSERWANKSEIEHQFHPLRSVAFSHMTKFCKGRDWICCFFFASWRLFDEWTNVNTY